MCTGSKGCGQMCTRMRRSEGSLGFPSFLGHIQALFETVSPVGLELIERFQGCAHHQVTIGASLGLQLGACVSARHTQLFLWVLGTQAEALTFVRQNFTIQVISQCQNASFRSFIKTQK